LARFGWKHQEARVSETPTADGLLRAERQLQAAQLAGDVAALDRLLDDRLVAIGPDGSRYTKDDDLAGHRSGSSVISELVEEHVEVLVAGTTGVTFFIGRVSGTFEGQPMTARLRYTRTWVHDIEVGWRIVAAHIAVLAPQA
jgi:ketosteroid isomerase-like protein